VNRVEKSADEHTSTAHAALQPLDFVSQVEPLSCYMWVNAAQEVVRGAEATERFVAATAMWKAAAARALQARGYHGSHGGIGTVVPAGTVMSATSLLDVLAQSLSA
jgi:hypothetical protein